MKGIVLHPKKALSKQEVGSSKLFGNPDVWQGFEWPAVGDGDECYDLDFIAQINCEEASKYDADGVLPKKGILYFFYDFVSCPNAPTDKNAARVLFYEGSTSKLSELVLVNDDGTDDAISFPSPLQFSTGNYQAKRAKLQMCYDAKEAEDFTVLLRINSFSAVNGKLKFSDAGALLLLIDPVKLKNKDFSDIRAKLIYN